MTASSPASWSRFSSVRLQILLVGTCHCRQCGSWSVAGHNHRKTPFVQVSTAWALTCPETVHQRPCMTRQVETWLSDSRVGNVCWSHGRTGRDVVWGVGSGGPKWGHFLGQSMPKLASGRCLNFIRKTAKAIRLLATSTVATCSTP